MDNAVIFFSGFQQSWKKLSGVESIWSRIYDKFAGPDFLVLPPFQWDVNTDNIVHLIERNCHHHASIWVIAYSWGGGAAFTSFSRALQHRFYKIKNAILCDPVYRSRYLPKYIPDIFALVKKKKIIIPSNVKSVHWIRQQIGPVCGHDLLLENTATKVFGPYNSDCDHLEIDDDPIFKNIVLETLTEDTKYLHEKT